MYMFLSFSLFGPAKTRVALVKSVKYLTKCAYLITTCCRTGSKPVTVCVLTLSYATLSSFHCGRFFFCKEYMEKEAFYFSFDEMGNVVNFK